MFERLKNFFVNNPKYIDDVDYEEYASYTSSLNILFLINVLLRGMFMIFFSYFRILPMMIFDAIAMIMYVAFVILIKNVKWSWATCICVTIFETYCHNVLGVVLFGGDAGFQYMLVPIIIVTMFIKYKSKVAMFFRNFCFVIVSVTFVLLTILMQDYTTVFSIAPEAVWAMLIVNSFMSFIIMAVFINKIYSSMDTLRMKLKTTVKQRENTIVKMQSQIIISFADVIEARDGSTGKHVKRTSEYVEALVYELKRNKELSDVITNQFVHDIILSAPLHDIGKITIPDAILQKPNKLTEQEFEIIKMHTVNGKRLIEKSMGDIEDSEFLTMAKQVAAYHHECWDGSGYPYGLIGKEIPLPARIMSIADFFDAIVTKRCYKEAMTFDEAFELIESQKGKKFDPVITDAFLTIRKQIEYIARTTQ